MAPVHRTPDERRVRRALEDAGVDQPCPACGEDEWAIGDAYIGLGRYHADHEEDEWHDTEEITTCVMRVCTTCGHTDLHDTDTLGIDPWNRE